MMESQNSIRKKITTIESLPIEQWREIYPSYYTWLQDNGFRYFKKFDKNQNKKLEAKEGKE